MNFLNILITSENDTNIKEKERIEISIKSFLPQKIEEIKNLEDTK